MQRSILQNHALRHGFSLVELAYTIAIIGIMAAIALPHWSSSIQTYQLNLAARRVASDLTWAQSCANGASASVTVSFDSSKSIYQIVGVTDPDHPAGTYTVDLTADPYHATVTSVSFGGVPQIVFNGYGMPTQGGDVVVAVGGTQRTINVDATSGRILVQ
jgi:prepilin-type N-terminal cleavage/methylation domain-containing protein